MMQKLYENEIIEYYGTLFDLLMGKLIKIADFFNIESNNQTVQGKFSNQLQ